MTTPRSYLAPDDRRASLIDAAGRVFEQGGLDAITMVAVAREAGVSRALVYQFFPDQTSLKLGLFADRLERFQRSVDLHADPDRPLADRAMLSFDALVSMPQPDLVALSAILHNHGDPELTAIRTRLREFSLTRLAPFLDLSPGPNPVRAGLWLYTEIMVSLALAVVEGEMPVHLARALFASLVAAGMARP